MERFYFHVDYGEHTADPEGTLLPGPEAARTAAVGLLGEILRDQASSFWAKPEITVTVEDARGATLWVLHTAGRADSASDVRSA